LQVRLERLDRLLVDPFGSPVGRDPSPASQTSRLEIANGLPSDFGSLTGSSHVTAVAQRTSPDDRYPSLQPHYGAFIATTGRSAPVATHPYATPRGSAA
jgi:hypothetical protein